MLDHSTQYRGSFQQLADARRVLKVTNSLRTASALRAEDRQELERIRALAIRAIEAATEQLIETLDELYGDTDLEPNGDELDGSSEEDDIPTPSRSDPWCGAGCPVADPDSGIEDEREGTYGLDS